jgi:hypothetical protein
MRPSASAAALSKWCDTDGSPSFDVITHSHRRGWHSRALAVEDGDRTKTGRFQRHWAPTGASGAVAFSRPTECRSRFLSRFGPRGFTTPLSGPPSTSGGVARGERPSSLTPTASRRAAGTASRPDARPTADDKHQLPPMSASNGCLPPRNTVGRSHSLPVSGRWRGRPAGARRWSVCSSGCRP